MLGGDTTHDLKNGRACMDESMKKEIEMVNQRDAEHGLYFNPIRLQCYSSGKKIEKKGRSKAPH